MCRSLSYENSQPLFVKYCLPSQLHPPTRHMMLGLFTFLLFLGFFTFLVPSFLCHILVLNNLCLCSRMVILSSAVSNLPFNPLSAFFILTLTFFSFPEIPLDRLLWSLLVVFISCSFLNLFYLYKYFITFTLGLCLVIPISEVPTGSNSVVWLLPTLVVAFSTCAVLSLWWCDVILGACGPAVGVLSSETTWIASVESGASWSGTAYPPSRPWLSAGVQCSPPMPQVAVLAHALSSGWPHLCFA